MLMGGWGPIGQGTEGCRDFQPAALVFGASPAFVGDSDRQRLQGKGQLPLGRGARDMLV